MLYTQQDDDDDDDFSGPALGGPVNVRSDSDDEDEPPTMGKMLAKQAGKQQFKNQQHLTPTVLGATNVSRKKPFRMEVVDF
ncbi:hypothetical protein AND_001135 [Anopheles darlingi]|uniref:Uncharacterized protein n=1 Tax=Anopheles darlingi TaxID=43151 RepID=W5JSH2_ANODA|nr:hypothetical protein AND_001135 [Anopheles darlingi]